MVPQVDLKVIAKAMGLKSEVRKLSGVSTSPLTDAGVRRWSVLGYKRYLWPWKETILGDERGPGADPLSQPDEGAF